MSRKANVVLCAAVAAMGFASSVNAAIVINEVYPGGGNAGAALNADYFRIYNNGLTSEPIGGFTLQYGSATGNFASNTFTSASIPANATVAPGGYYTISGPAATGTATGTFTTFGSDLASQVNAAVAGGKIRLLDTAGATVDLVGWGTATAATATSAGGTGPGFETAAAGAPSGNAQSIFRTVTGVDTNNNLADFSAGNPTLVPEPAAVGLVAAAGALLVGRRRR
jgi:hypothetical protein